MSYKFSTGSLRQGDIYYEDDREGSPTYIDFGMDTITLRPSGTAQLYVEDGKVGIGTTSPDHTLHVKSPGTCHVKIESEAGEESALKLSQDGQSSAYVWMPGGTSDLRFYVNSADRMHIDNDGNVGIATTDPDSTLHVAGSTHLSNSSGTEVLKIAKADGDSREIVFENEGADAASIYLNSAEHLFIRQENSSNDLCLRIASTNALRVDGSASTVGIWTDSPVTGFDAHFNSMAMSNDTGGGWVVKFGSGTLTAGKLYYLHTDGTWTETDADAASSGGDQLLGIALGTTPGTHGVLLRGFFDAHTYLDTHTSGKAVYIGTTAANMTTTAPSATGDIIRIIGYCTSQSKVIYFNPSSTFVELS